MTIITKLVPNLVYEKLASDDQIDRTAAALQSHGMRVMVVDDKDQARKKVLELLPKGAEVYAASSRTLESLGIPDEIDAHYNSVRSRTAKLDRMTQVREISHLTASPEYILGSVHAVTEDGQVVIASFGGRQLPGYAAGAGHVIWVVGAQKIVPTLEEGMKRIREYSYPREDARLLEALGRNSGINKILIISREVVPDRITMVIVREKLGF